MPELLSLYHQTCLENARKHLCFPSDLTPLPVEFQGNSRLGQIWGGNPILAITTRHSEINPASRYLSSDYLVGKLIDQAPRNTQISNLIWESHPQGLGTIQLGIDSGVIGPKVPNVIQWGKPHPTAFDALKSYLAPETINKALQEAINEAKENGASDEKVEIARYRTESILYALSQILDACEVKNHSLSRITLNLETRLRDRLGNPIQKLWLLQPSSDSLINQQVAQTLEIIDEKLGLENTFDRLLDAGQGSLFIGGRGERLAKVGFSKNSKRFEVVHQDPTTEKKIGKPKTIPSGELLGLLRSNELIATGKAFSLSILLASTQAPVVYFGNSHDEFSRAQKALNVDNYQGLMQATNEWHDSWPPIVIKKGDRIVTPGLFTLYIWLGRKLKDYIYKSLPEAMPVTMGIEKYYSL